MHVLPDGLFSLGKNNLSATPDDTVKLYIFYT